MQKKHIFNPKLVAEAEVKGLTLIGAAKISSYREYEFMECLHKQEIATTCVRRNRFTCKTCVKHRLESDALKVGLIILNKGRDSGHRRYKFLRCGHEQEMSIYRVGTNFFKCRTCFQKKLEKEAERSGLTLIGVGKTAHYRKYKFLSCQHEQEIDVAGVRANEFKCKTCFSKKLENEAKANGLTILGKGKNYQYRNYKFFSCQHEQQIQIAHVRASGFVCQQCEETTRTLPSSAYLLRINSGGFQWLKFGYSRNIHNRISAYGLQKESQIEILAVCDFDTGNEAHKFEARIHKLHARNRLDSEVMKNYHTISGFNECYPSWCEATLRTTLEHEASKEDTRQTELI